MSEVTSYSDEQRDLVYRVWAFEANRSSLETARRLVDSDDMRALGVSAVNDRTIRRWAKEFGWASKADQELYAIAPDLRYSAQSTLALAAPEAAIELRKLIHLDVERDMPVTIGKGDDAVTIIVRQLDKDALKAKITAIQLTLDRSGFSPIGTREIGRLDTPPTVLDTLDDAIAKASAEELDDIERELKKRLEMGSIAIGVGSRKQVRT